MLNRPGNDRHRQLRCVREERRRRQMHNGANRAVIVAVVVVMLRRGGQMAGRCVSNGNGSLGSDAVEVHVPERQHELQPHRSEREPSATPPVGTNPTHHASSPSRAIGAPTLYSRTDHRGQCGQVAHIAVRIPLAPTVACLLQATADCNPHAGHPDHPVLLSYPCR
jgi:hypothetical protein